MDQNNICAACGTEFPADNAIPGLCPICNDDRQFIPEKGQRWTSLTELSDNYTVAFRKINDNLHELKMSPSFAIGQRTFLILSPGGNILWDCIPLLNESTIDFIRSKGGLKAIVFSHPHYYSTMNQWAEVFNCPVYIHRDDEQWIMNKGSYIQLWSGNEKTLWDNIRVINIGGHFPGSSILHIPSMSSRGTVLCGDTLYISPSKRHIAVMYSYPNHIPLPPKEMDRIKELLSHIEFDTLYGAFEFQNLTEDVQLILSNSMKKYTDHRL